MSSSRCGPVLVRWADPVLVALKSVAGVGSSAGGGLTLAPLSPAEGRLPPVVSSVAARGSPSSVDWEERGGSACRCAPEAAVVVLMPADRSPQGCNTRRVEWHDPFGEAKRAASGKRQAASGKRQAASGKRAAPAPTPRVLDALVRWDVARRRPQTPCPARDRAKRGRRDAPRHIPRAAAAARGADRHPRRLRRKRQVSWLRVITAAIILAAVAVIAGVFLLWRSTPAEPERPEPSEDDRTKDTIVDLTPGGGGGGN